MTDELKAKRVEDHLVASFAGDVRALVSKRALVTVGKVWGPQLVSTKQLTYDQFTQAAANGERVGELGTVSR